MVLFDTEHDILLIVYLHAVIYKNPTSRTSTLTSGNSRPSSHFYQPNKSVTKEIVVNKSMHFTLKK